MQMYQADVSCKFIMQIYLQGESEADIEGLLMVPYDELSVPGQSIYYRTCTTVAVDIIYSIQFTSRV